MITVNSIYNQVTDNLTRSNINFSESNQTEDDNKFQDILDTAETNIRNTNQIETALQLVSDRFGIPYNTIKNNLGGESDNFIEKAKSFLYGLAVATSNNTSSVNTVLNGTATTATTLPYTALANFASYQSGNNSLSLLPY